MITWTRTRALQWNIYIVTYIETIVGELSGTLTDVLAGQRV